MKTKSWLELETCAAEKEAKRLPKWALLASRFEPFAECPTAAPQKEGEDVE